MAVHDRLRQAGRAGGEQHVERVRERQRVERERARLGEERVPRHGVRERVVGAADVRDVDDGLQARQARADLGHLLTAVDLASPRTGSPRQRRRTFGSSWPSRWRTLRTPNSGGHVAQIAPRLARREERDERLRDVRQVRDDAVARADAEPLQPCASARDLLPEVAERELHAARASASTRRPPPRRGPRPGRPCARRSSAARPGTTRRRASRASRARARTVRASGPRRTPRSTTRSASRSVPTTARAPRSRGSRGRVRCAATPGSGRARSARARPPAASRGRRPWVSGPAVARAHALRS